MSYQESKTDWSEADTFKTNDANRIEGNVDYLKTAVDSNAADISTNTADISTNTADISTEESVRAAADTALSNRISPIEAWTNQGVNTTSSPTFAGLSLTGSFNPEASPTSGSYSSGSGGGTYTLPRGLYNISLTSYGATISIEINISGSWYGMQTVSVLNSFAGGAIVSDGSNVRINTNGTAAIARWLKF